MSNVLPFHRKHYDKKLLRYLMQYFRLPVDSEHGPAHWMRVLRNGLKIAANTPGADEQVVTLFALLHDAERYHEYDDEHHGMRAAILARSLANQPDTFSISEEKLTILEHALSVHSEGDTSDDPTIGACWDADRLDLMRVGTPPHPKYLSTDYAKRREVMAEANNRAMRWRTIKMGQRS